MVKSIIDTQKTSALENTYTPIFFKLSNPKDKEDFNKLISGDKNLFVHDEIYSQLQELIKCRNPSKKITQVQYSEYINTHLDGQNLNEYGVWAYYPWRTMLIHLLDEEEFVKVRTNRNQYKITNEEQEELKSKKIGIVGLSVGQSIALTLAMERTCGELRLADFDTIELSNLNRLRTGLHNLGLKKTIIAAREIAEIDPFLKVKIFSDGLNNDNMDDFFIKDGKLDLLIEVCDGLDIKIESRYKARELKIPVVMDTNDRGMLDVERFDLESDRDILHGLAEGLDPENIKDLTNEEKVPFILKMIGAETLSTRLKASMIEVEQSINTWPQLASSVTLGGALTTDVGRRILLDQFHDSGRYIVDLEELVKDKVQVKQKKYSDEVNPYFPLETESLSRIINHYFETANKAGFIPTQEQLNKIIDAAIIAPSAGNNQPWKWIYRKGILFLFHDKHRSWSWGDFFEMGSHMSLGTALENVHLQSESLNLKDRIELFPMPNEKSLIAVIRFEELRTPVNKLNINLAENLYSRHTNRKLADKQDLPIDFFDRLNEIIKNDKTIHVFHTENEAQITELAEIIAECDKIRLMDEKGHEEFFHEVRWTAEDAKETRDGIELAAVDVSKSEIAGFRVAQDWKAVELLAKWDKGNAFKKVSTKAVESASSIFIFAIPEFNHKELINVGRTIQKAWIFANMNKISVHPMLSPIFFFNKIIHGNEMDFKKEDLGKLKNLRERFLKIFPLDKNDNLKLSEVFLMKLFIADEMEAKSLRRTKDECYMYIKD